LAIVFKGEIFVMKKVLKNKEIDALVSTMMSENSFIKTTRMPHALRQAIRVNLNILVDRLKIYEEGHKEICDSYVNDGKAAKKDDNSITVNKEYLQDINKEFEELANVENELDIETVKKDIIDEVLENNDLTLGEEDVLLFFSDDGETATSNS